MVEESLPFPICAAYGHALAMLTPLAYLQGACGYGYIKKNEWPYWSVGALTPGNQFARAGPAHACGYADLPFHLTLFTRVAWTGRAWLHALVSGSGCSITVPQAPVLIQEQCLP